MTTTDGLEEYKAIEDRIKKNRREALFGRWEFGRKLLAERGEAGRLPNGRLRELANALELSTTEVNNRMRFAEQYDSEGKVQVAFARYGSWYAICKSGLRVGDPITGYRSAPDLDTVVVWQRLCFSIARFLQPGCGPELEWLRIVAEDRTALHPIEIDQLVAEVLDLWHRVSAVLSSLRERRLILPSMEPLSAELERSLSQHQGPTLMDLVADVTKLQTPLEPEPIEAA